MNLQSIRFPGLDEVYSVSPNPIAIPSGADINDYTTAGSYKCPSADIAKSLKNTPYTGGGFKLDVIPLSNDNYLMQEIRCNAADSQVYRRRVSRSSSTSTLVYAEWYQPVQSTDGLVPISLGGTGAATPIEALANLFALNLNDITDERFMVQSGDDYDNFTTPGAYRIATSTIAASLLHKPSYDSAGGRFIVSATSSSSAGRIQIVIFNTLKYQIYFRVKGSTGEWGEWDYLKTSNHMPDYVVAEGISGDWYYRKWNSGRAECYLDNGVVTPSSGNGAKYHSVTLPFTFSNNYYHVSVTGVKGVNQNYAHDFLIGDSSSNDGRTATTVTFNYTYSANTAYNVGFTMHVMGRWK